MKRIAIIISSFAALTLIAACVTETVYVDRRLPLPTEPQYPPIRMKIGEPLTEGIARDVTIRDFLLHDYISKLKTVIKSTWGEE